MRGKNEVLEQGMGTKILRLESKATDRRKRKAKKRSCSKSNNCVIRNTEKKVARLGWVQCRHLVFIV